MGINAKAPFAVIVALVILQIGWLALSGLLFALLYVITNMRDGGTALTQNYILLAWMLGAGFGGFCGVYVASRVFKSVKPNTIANAFSLVISALLVLGALPTLFEPSYGTPIFPSR